MSKKTVFGIPFSNIGLGAAAQSILSGRYDGKIIVTPNVNHVSRLHEDSSFKKIYLASDVFLNDSRILGILSKLVRKPIKYLVPGSDLTAMLFDMLKNQTDTSIAIIGGNDEVLSDLKKIYGLKKISHYNPPMDFHLSELEMNKCLSVCREASASICFLAVGSPKQEFLADYLRSNGVKGCYLCIGASLLFLTGKEKRAPLFMRKLALEWLFRLLQSPRRLFKRYVFDMPKISKIFINELINR